MKALILSVISCGSISLVILFTSCAMNDVAISLPRYKVAVVDITKVMEQSKEIKALKASQDKQMKELETLISKAQNEIVNTHDQNKAMQLQANYSKEIETKRNAIDEEYSKKIVQITSNIKNFITLHFFNPNV